MAVVIRVHPNNGLGGGYGYGGYAPLAQVQLKNQKDKDAMQLKYERALFNERLKTVQLQTAIQAGTSGTTTSGLTPLSGGILPGGILGASLIPGTSIPYASALAGMGFGGMGLLSATSGQSNPNSQSATASGGTVNQSVSNSNQQTTNIFGMGGFSPFGGMGGCSPFGTGGWMGGLLGSIF